MLDLRIVHKSGSLVCVMLGIFCLFAFDTNKDYAAKRNMQEPTYQIQQIFVYSISIESILKIFLKYIIVIS